MAGAAIVVLLASDVRAQVTDPTELKAREAFVAGRYDEALTLFAKLYAETLHPVYLRNVGRCHQKMREPEKAIDAFRDYLAKSKKISRDERREVEGYIKEMEALREGQGKAGATPSRTPTVAPTPPAQSSTASAGASSSPASALTTVANPQRPSQQPNLLVTQSPPPEGERPFYTKWWFWTGIGVVAAGAVVTAILLSGGVDRPSCDVEQCQ